MRYYFEFSGPAAWRDTEGLEFPDLAAARAAAIRACGEWMRDEAERFARTGRFGLVIRDGEGRVLDAINFAWEALTPQAA